MADVIKSISLHRILFFLALFISIISLPLFSMFNCCVLAIAKSLFRTLIHFLQKNLYSVESEVMLYNLQDTAKWKLILIPALGGLAVGHSYFIAKISTAYNCGSDSRNNQRAECSKLCFIPRTAPLCHYGYIYCINKCVFYKIFL